MDADVKDALLRLLRNSKAGTVKGGFWARAWSILNSAFVLTVIGGVFLASVSALITQFTAQNTKSRELAVERLRARQAFVQSFSSKLERYFELTLSLRKREIFLRNWQSSDRRSTIHYPDGRNFDETRIFWEQEKKYWLDQSTESPVGLINAGKILFSEPPVRNELNKLSGALDHYGSATTTFGLTESYTEVLECLKQTAISMADNVYEK